MFVIIGPTREAFLQGDLGDETWMKWGCGRGENLGRSWTIVRRIQKSLEIKATILKASCFVGLCLSRPTMAPVVKGGIPSVSPLAQKVLMEGPCVMFRLASQGQVRPGLWPIPPAEMWWARGVSFVGIWITTLELFFPGSLIKWGFWNLLMCRLTSDFVFEGLFFVLAFG